MYFKRLQLENFRCFKSADISFPKIAIFTGKNSSGKSTAINALLSTLQGAGEASFPVCLPANGNLCSLGGFKLLVHKGQVNRKVRVAIEVGNGPVPQKKSTAAPETFIFDSIYRAAKINDGICLEELNASDSMGALSIKRKSQFEVKFTQKSKESAESEAFVHEIFKFIDKATHKDKAKPFTLPTMSRSLFRKTSDIGSWHDLRLLFKNEFHASTFIQHINNTIEQAKVWTRYIGPSRLYPNRYYYDRAGKDIGARGENLAGVLFRWRQSDKARISQLTRYLKEMGLASSLDLFHRNDNLFQLYLGIKGAATPTSLEDVGFGLSQILPILASDVQLGEGGTLITSQPELHLHPSAQAKIADYMVKRTSDMKRQYIVETHSEYLINRLRLSVVKGHLKEDDVVLYHFELRNGQSTPTRITINRKGQLIGAPKDFFDTYRIDAFNIALAI